MMKVGAMLGEAWGWFRVNEYLVDALVARGVGDAARDLDMVYTAAWMHGTVCKRTPLLWTCSGRATVTDQA